MMRWWERYAGSLDEELKALENLGAEPRLNDELLKQGVVSIDVRVSILGNARFGRIEYPELFPYFRPRLYVPELGRNVRHWNPLNGEICLLGRASENWHPRMTAAALLGDQLSQWEEAAVHAYDEERTSGEDSQAEPASAYFPYQPGQMVFVDNSQELPAGLVWGWMKVATAKGRNSIGRDSSWTGWVVEIAGSDRKDVIAAPEADIKEWAERQGLESFVCPWIALDQPPTSLDTLLDDVLAWLAAKEPDAPGKILPFQASKKSGLLALCFPEESPGGGMRSGWLFIAHCRAPKLKKKERDSTKQVARWIVTAEGIGRTGLFERVPELSPLREKTIAVVGLGCIGAPSALAFAKAGVGELRLLDGDYVSPAAGCRWPLGFSAGGQGKVVALVEFIRANYPMTKIGTTHHPAESGYDLRMRIGEPSPHLNQFDVLDRLIDGADLIYDATAEEAINHLLSDMARTRGVPYVTVSSRPGGWGGNVVRVRPDKATGCYLCYLKMLEEETISRPPHDPDGEMQQAGCGDVSFKAASFDVEEIALAGVRLGVSTLCEGLPGYPVTDNDIGILSVRAGGKCTFPVWESFPLPRHADCEGLGHAEDMD